MDTRPCQKTYAPYIISTEFTNLKTVLKSKEPVIVITNPEFYDAFCKYIKGTVKTTKAGAKSMGGTLACIGLGAAATFAWPLAIPAAIAGVIGVVQFGNYTVNTILDSCIANLKHYKPLLDTAHSYVYLFNMEKNGYQNGCPVDTSKLYKDTSEKTELRDPASGGIRIPNVNDICADDRV